MYDKDPIKCIKECPAYQPSEWVKGKGVCLLCGTGKDCRHTLGSSCRLSINIKVIAFRLGVKESALINEHDFESDQGG